jgi:hypothetical protein
MDDTIFYFIIGMLYSLALLTFLIGGFVIWLLTSRRGSAFAEKHPKIKEFLTK